MAFISIKRTSKRRAKKVETFISYCKECAEMRKFFDGYCQVCGKAKWDRNGK